MKSIFNQGTRVVGGYDFIFHGLDDAEKATMTVDIFVDVSFLGVKAINQS
jgi:hypothetical protein